ncbi:MAG TPA: hypothetical protein VFB20_03725 [Burkholderiales bacterium]|nr:hypothetical protein [Burkholderiales bacterium]
MNLSDPVLAAVIGASATIATALVQLRTSWRKELAERERGQPITKKSRRGPVLAVLALLIAAAVGGFALSQYLFVRSERDNGALRMELRSQLSELSASAARLEQARLEDRSRIEAEVRRAEAVRSGQEGVAAAVTVPPCKPAGAAASAAKGGCSEEQALRVAVCASIPGAATVNEVVLYTRFEDVQQPWTEARVAPDQDAGQARFYDKPFDRADGETTKQVCQRFASWNAERARVARILVKYAP